MPDGWEEVSSVEGVTSTAPSAPLETERLLLRRLSAADAADLFRTVGDPDVMRYWHPGPDVDLAAVRRRIAEIERHWRRHGFGDWGVVDKADGELLGFAGLHHIVEMDEVNVGYALARSHWGRGLGSELVRFLLAYGLERLCLPEVVAVIDPRNEASIALAVSGGLDLRERRLWRGHERLVYGISRVGRHEVERSSHV